MYNAVGAKQVWKTPPYPHTHNLGSCRMSARAKDGVVNKWGRTHDVKNLFVSDGSVMTTGAAANPTSRTPSLSRCRDGLMVCDVNLGLCRQVKDKWGFQMTARYDMYAAFFREFTDMNYEPQVIKDPSLGDTEDDFTF